jgi:hypothetical protein
MAQNLPVFFCFLTICYVQGEPSLDVSALLTVRVEQVYDQREMKMTVRNVVCVLSIFQVVTCTVLCKLTTYSTVAYTGKLAPLSHIHSYTPTPSSPAIVTATTTSCMLRVKFRLISFQSRQLMLLHLTFFKIQF